MTAEIEKILTKLDDKKNFKYTPTTLDTDIESVKVGKDYGMKRILRWLKENDFEAEKFITFGDSLGDLDMATHLAEIEHNVEFIFVGDKSINPENYSFPIIIPVNKYDQGTLEYLQSH